MSPPSRQHTTAHKALAQRQWEELLSSLAAQGRTGSLARDEELHTLLNPLFGNTRFLFHFLNRQPQEVLKLQRSPFLKQPKTFATMAGELAAQLQQGQKPWQDILLDYKYSEYLRLTLRQLGRLDTIFVVLAELSSLAQCLLTRATDLVLQDATQALGPTPRSAGKIPYSLVALGKLGAGELNYSSDIDLIACYADPPAPETATAWGEYFVHITQQLTYELAQIRSQGFLYRIDWDLRPQGRQGLLCPSQNALQTYYESWGDEWERFAWLRARPVSGNIALGKDLVTSLAPFVFRRHLDFSVFEHMRALKKRINEGLSDHQGWNVKLGRGGIRELEFFVQTFQILYGGLDHELQSHSTLEALEKIVRKKLIPSQIGRDLAAAYGFLRRLENCLQMVDETQTHTLPYDESVRLAIARPMGYWEESEEKALRQFEHDLAAHQNLIGLAFDDLLGEPT